MTVVRDREPVAILMAVYAGDRPDNLVAALDSLHEQTYRALHIYVAVDGPIPSRLHEVLRDADTRYPDFHVRKHAQHRCLAACLNDLIAEIQTRYSYFARMDADDVCYPERIERQLQFLKNHPEIDVVGGAITDIDEDGRELKRVDYPQEHDSIMRFFVRRNPIAHVTAMFRRSFFEKAGLYPPVPLEDGLYWMQAIRAGCRFHNLQIPLVYVRRSADYLRRRSGLRHCWGELCVRLTINRHLRFGPAAYIYAVTTFGLQMMPVRVKHMLYDRLR